MNRKDPYKSKLGRLFRIAKICKPREGEVVFFSEDEWIWIKAQDLNSEQFDLLWRFKYEDYRHEIITESIRAEQKEIAKKYSTAILESLGRKVKKGDTGESDKNMETPK